MKLRGAILCVVLTLLFASIKEKSVPRCSTLFLCRELNRLGSLHRYRQHYQPHSKDQYLENLYFICQRHARVVCLCHTCGDNFSFFFFLFISAHRLHKRLAPVCHALVCRDCTLLPPLKSPTTTTEPVFCVELKPKQGFLSWGHEHCPFCLNQFLKVRLVLLSARLQRFCFAPFSRNRLNWWLLTLFSSFRFVCRGNTARSNCWASTALSICSRPGEVTELFHARACVAHEALSRRAFRFRWIALNSLTRIYWKKEGERRGREPCCVLFFLFRA